MITNQHIEESLSRACVQAIAATAGLNLSKPELDYGVDGTFNEVSIINRRRCQSGFLLNYQLKASTSWQQSGDQIIYDLEAKTYNDLLQMQVDVAVPCVLILLTLLKEPQQWLECTETRVIIRGGCYWYYPRGSFTSNQSSKRIHIDKQQLLTPKSVVDLINKIKIGRLY